MLEQKPREMSHTSDNLVIECMDHRFHPTVRAHLAEEFGIDIDRSDRLIDAGASKAVLDGGFLERCSLSSDLHEIKNIFIYDHIDCGGFGGLKAFDGDEEREREAHVQSQTRAKVAIAKLLPQLVTRIFVVNLDGRVIDSEEAA